MDLDVTEHISIWAYIVCIHILLWFESLKIPHETDERRKVDRGSTFIGWVFVCMDAGKTTMRLLILATQKLEWLQRLAWKNRVQICEVFHILFREILQAEWNDIFKELKEKLPTKNSLPRKVIGIIQQWRRGLRSSRWQSRTCAHYFLWEYQNHI